MRSAALLSPSLSSAIGTIRWPLGEGSSPPLNFQDLQGMQALRSSTSSSNLLLDAAHPLRSNLSGVLSEILAQSMTDEEKEFLIVSTAFILLGNGQTDEAHNLVTPLTWPEETHFGHGPSVYTKVSGGPKIFATYLHALIHRREAYNVGEFGMSGFQNANYWSKAFLSSAMNQPFPHVDLYIKLKKLVQTYSGDEGVVHWAKDHEMIDEENSFYEARAVHELCGDVLRGGTSATVKEFAEKVSEMEVRVLLAHSLQGAGYDFTVDSVLNERVA